MWLIYNHFIIHDRKNLHAWLLTIVATLCVVMKILVKVWSKEGVIKEEIGRI